MKTKACSVMIRMWKMAHAVPATMWPAASAKPVALSATGILLTLGHIVAGSVWAIFHILIITLQAFVFMMLTLVYIGQAHDSH